jgi:hypothetical protein
MLGAALMFFMGNENLIGDVDVSVAARLPKFLYPLSRRRITQLCQQGFFKSAHKKGAGRNSKWFISASEIVRHKLNHHAIIQEY